MKRVAVQYAGSGVGTVDKLAAVIAQHSNLIADAGQDALSSSRKSCKKVRLDKAFRYEQISLHSNPVNYQRRAGGKNAHLNVAGCVAAVMNDDFFIIHDFLAHFGNELLLRSRSMKSGSYQQCNVDIRIPFAQFFEHMRKDIAAGYRAGVVAYDNDRALFSLGQFGKLWTVNGVLHRFFYDVTAIAFAFELIDSRCEYSGACGIKLNKRFSIRKMHHHSTSLLSI
ncbi:hypothetical protein SDC9_88040 [bioreactor metagenome]|uniref:Uncharacterized protein n=1 Tax=bioreactor metagenome TaxID=1076179 RepID=A0A644ZKG7_9ZZZZ